MSKSKKKSKPLGFKRRLSRYHFMPIFKTTRQELGVQLLAAIGLYMVYRYWSTTDYGKEIIPIVLFGVFLLGLFLIVSLGSPGSYLYSRWERETNRKQAKIQFRYLRDYYMDWFEQDIMKFKIFDKEFIQVPNWWIFIFNQMIVILVFRELWTVTLFPIAMAIALKVLLIIKPNSHFVWFMVPEDFWERVKVCEGLMREERRG